MFPSVGSFLFPLFGAQMFALSTVPQQHSRLNVTPLKPSGHANALSALHRKCPSFCSLSIMCMVLSPNTFLHIISLSSAGRLIRCDRVCSIVLPRREAPGQTGAFSERVTGMLRRWEAERFASGRGAIFWRRSKRFFSGCSEGRWRREGQQHAAIVIQAQRIGPQTMPTAMLATVEPRIFSKWQG